MYYHNKTIQKTINFDNVVKEETKKYNPNRPQDPDHLYRVFII